MLLLAVFAVVLASAFLPGCGGTKQTRVVRMGFVLDDIHDLAYYVARENGFFQSEGLDMREGGAFNSGAELMSAFSAGGLDMGYVGVSPAVTFQAQDMVDIKIVAAVNTEGSALVARSALEGEDPAALKGRTVAIPGFSTVQDLLLRMALRKAGLSQSDVTIVSLMPADMPDALRASRIDAFLAWEPHPAQSVKDRTGRVLANSKGIWPGHPCCVLVADSAFLRRNPDTVRGVVEAHVTATRYIKDNPLEAADMAHLFTGQDAGITREAMENIDFTYTIDDKKLARYVSFLAEQGVVEKSEAGSLTGGMVDERFLPVKEERKK